MAENQVPEQKAINCFAVCEQRPKRHSWQAYMIIKTIHLMNSGNMVTLARISEDSALANATGAGYGFAFRGQIPRIQGS
jgi:hypothetical protein